MKFKHYLSLVVFIIFAGLLSACDPITYPYFIANRIVTTNEIAYLHVSEQLSWGPGCCPFNEDHYFVSKDFGKTWQEITSPPVEMPPSVENSDVAKFVTCVPNDPEICYRIIGKEQVEISNDGGSTWQVDWKTPLGRRKYMQKNPEITRLVGVVPDTVPYDFGIIPVGDGHYVIAAMGNQGVLVKSTTGEWERYAISFVEFPKLGIPLPYYATSLNDVRLALSTEVTWTGLTAFIFWGSLSFFSWRNVYSVVDKSARSKILWSGMPFFFTTMGLILFFLILLFVTFVGLFIPDFMNSLVVDLFLDLAFNTPTYICLTPIIGLIISWSIFAAFSPNRKGGLRAALMSLVFALMFITGILLPFVLWAFGIIPIYEIALIAAGILGLLSIYFSFLREKQLVISATRSKNHQY